MNNYSETKEGAKLDGPCWLFDELSGKWSHWGEFTFHVPRYAPPLNPFKFTHYHPDQPTAPTSIPSPVSSQESEGTGETVLFKDLDEAMEFHRKLHAAPNQPAQEAAMSPGSGEASLVRWLQNMVSLNDQLKRAADNEHDRNKFRHYVSAYESALVKALQLAQPATPPLPSGEEPVITWGTKSAPSLPVVRDVGGTRGDGKLAKGLRDTIAACLVHWKNELEVEGRAPPAQTDMALLAEILIYGCRLCRAQADAGRDEK